MGAANKASLLMALSEHVAVSCSCGPRANSGTSSSRWASSSGEPGVNEPEKACQVGSGGKVVGAGTPAGKGFNTAVREGGAPIAALVKAAIALSKILRLGWWVLILKVVIKTSVVGAKRP